MRVPADRRQRHHRPHVSERGVAPDVYLKRQDGRVARRDHRADAARRRNASYIFLLDGQINTELSCRLESNPTRSRTCARLIERGTMLRLRLHHQLPEHHLAQPQRHRHRRLVRPPRHRQPDLLPPRDARDRHAAGPAVRHREVPRRRRRDAVRGLPSRVRRLGRRHGGALTASIIEPCTRGADHATLERRLVGERAS